MDMYQNPVYGHNFPDPFVLKFRGAYWAYGTGIQADGRCFGVLHSPDLVTWQFLGGALEPLPEGWSEYWAPEVTYDNGRFLMYYSVGNEEHMEIRVASAPHPGGPFVDSGRRLTNEPFAIDAHVFVDDDGKRYLFYATDFLQHSHIGTGTVRDRLLNALTLAGSPEPVTRARYEWQVYDPQRASKGGVRWHTIEGPFVLKHKGRYYQMFSGGNWQHPSYGVSYAIADSLSARGEWAQVADGMKVLPILRTQPTFTGPGHNSVVRGPDNRQLYCVYHYWPADMRGRVMAIDRLEWVGERMLVVGPTESAPTPIQPTVNSFSPTPTGELGPLWACTGGEWSARDGAATQGDSDAAIATATCQLDMPCGIVEATGRAIGYADDGGYGLAFFHEQTEVLRYLIHPSSQQVGIRIHGQPEPTVVRWRLPSGFQASTDHTLVADIGPGWGEIKLDERTVWRGRLPPITNAALMTNNAASVFTSFALTLGWQNLFDHEGSPSDHGWHSQQPDAWRIEDQALVGTSANEAIAARGPAFESYELVVNARLLEHVEGASYSILPVYDDATSPLRCTLEQSAAGWQIRAGDGLFALPESFDPLVFQQFRFRKQNGQLAIQWEQHPLGTLAADTAPTRVGLGVQHAAAFDMVRLTVLA